MPIAGFLQEGSLDYPLFHRHTVELMEKTPVNTAPEALDETHHPAENNSEKIKEIGGPKGLEPTRYGDWEKNGRCSDF